MIYLKTSDEIKVIREGGRRLNKILKTLLAEVKPGVRTVSLEKLAMQLITQAGGSPAFKDYPMGGGIFFPSALCVSINDEVVHGSSLPDREIKIGDIVDLDIGMEWPIMENERKKYNFPTNPHSQYGGYFTDMCATVGVGPITQEAKKLLRVTKECLDLAIKQAKPGNKMNDIARAIVYLANKHNFGIVRDLIGHGLGYFAHEGPDVFHYEINERSADNITLEPGLVIAIEPMINAGDWRVKIADNNYTFVTKDGSLSAHFEHTIAITNNGPEILTAS